MNDNEILRAAQEARAEVDRMYGREVTPEPDDFEPGPVPMPEFRGSTKIGKLTRQERLALLERGYGKPLPEPLQVAVLGPPPEPEVEGAEREPDAWDLEEAEDA